MANSTTFETFDDGVAGQPANDSGFGYFVDAVYSDEVKRGATGLSVTAPAGNPQTGGFIGHRGKCLPAGMTLEDVWAESYQSSFPDYEDFRTQVIAGYGSEQNGAEALAPVNGQNGVTYQRVASVDGWFYSTENSGIPSSAYNIQALVLDGAGAFLFSSTYGEPGPTFHLYWTTGVDGGGSPTTADIGLNTPFPLDEWVHLSAEHVDPEDFESDVRWQAVTASGDVLFDETVAYFNPPDNGYGSYSQAAAGVLNGTEMTFSLFVDDLTVVHQSCEMPDLDVEVGQNIMSDWVQFHHVREWLSADTHWFPKFTFYAEDGSAYLSPGDEVLIDCIYIPDNGLSIEEEPYLDGDQSYGIWEGEPRRSSSIFGVKKPVEGIVMGETLTFSDEEVG